MYKSKFSGVNWQIVRYLALQDMKSRFRRSRLGMLWLVFHQLSFSIAGGLIWAAVFNLNPLEFIPFLTLGFAVWGFVAAFFVDACGIFLVAHTYIKQTPIQKVTFIYRFVLVQLSYLSISLGVAVLVVSAIEPKNFLNLYYAVPGLLLILVVGFQIARFMAFVGVRFRDVPHAMGSLFSILFVVTPVIYPPEVLLSKGLWFAVYFNPLASFIDVIRHPILNGEFASVYSYLSIMVGIIVFALLARLVEHKWKDKIVFWL